MIKDKCLVITQDCNGIVNKENVNVQKLTSVEVMEIQQDDDVVVVIPMEWIIE